FHSDYRSIRLDLYAADAEGSRYNVEMQGENEGNLPLRSRFHQAELDATSLLPGEEFAELGPGYVIFICTFDPFGKGLYRYTFENRCLETDMSLGDGAFRIFLNTRGTNGDQVPETLLHFLRYVEDSTDACARDTADEAVNRLHDRVTSLKKSREWRSRYMKFEELLTKAERQGREKGLAEGREQEQSRFHTLISRMTAGGDGDRLAELANAAFLNEMYRKYSV
ncbi:MAG: Rpn family recombination-promoting nuclease/putative transposase, partial [Clostridium sp.]|nr:Rpn family recombination-promoting nuclease/putative transposase [Clostridium sp.]